MSGHQLFLESCPAAAMVDANALPSRLELFCTSVPWLTANPDTPTPTRVIGTTNRKNRKAMLAARMLPFRRRNRSYVARR
jgi:hypothetical protein